MESSTNTNIRHANHQYEHSLHFTGCIFSGIPVVKTSFILFYTLPLSKRREETQKVAGVCTKGSGWSFSYARCVCAHLLANVSLHSVSVFHVSV